MDWELYERQRATLVFISVAFLSFIFLAFQRSSGVQHLKAFFVACTLPAQRSFSHMASNPQPESPASPTVQPSVPTAVVPEDEFPAADKAADAHAEQVRALQVLKEQNTRLHNMLDLKQNRWPRLVAAQVVGRDPLRWFQEILLDKGSEDGVRVDDPVVALAGSREALVGRIVEAGAHTSRVMLIHDSLSSIAASVAGENGEDGVVEGSNSHDLYMKYLIRDSHIKIGDQVLTSGLGGTFPEGIPIGWVDDIGLDPRQLFVQARLRPAMAATPLRLVGILIKKE
jgi:hypothetical protein